MEGATPANIVNLYDYKTTPPFEDSVEYVAVYRTRPARRVPINENFADVTNLVTIYCHTPTGDDRLLEIVEEVRYVINTYAITGIHVQHVDEELDVSDRRKSVYATEINCILIANLADSTSGYAASAASTYHNHDGRILEHDGVDSDGGAFAFTTTGTVTFNQDIDVDGEIIFAGATLHSSGGEELHIHPNDGNKDGHLTLHPTGTSEISHVRLRNSVTPNWGALQIQINGVTVSIDSDQNGSGTAPTTLDITDADWADINISSTGKQTTVKGNLDVDEGLDVTGNITVTGTVDGVDVAGRDHAEYTDADAVAAAEAAGLSIATTKALAFDDGGSVDIIRDEDNMVSDDASAIATQQSIKKYVDDEVAGMTHPVEDAAFGAGWNGDTTNAPTQNAVYDVIRQRLFEPQPMIWNVGNGGLMSPNYGGAITLPANDANCYVASSMVMPTTWITGTATYLNVIYAMSGVGVAYSGLWRIKAWASGETDGTWNILNGSNAYDFAAVGTAYAELATRQVPLGTSIAAGDVVHIKFDSDAANAKILYIMGMNIVW